jgi:GDPmannose 4,6-dehydratase
MWMMLQHSKPDDFVVSTGKSYSVADFLSLASARSGLDWHAFVEKDSRYLRPTEVDFLKGDSSKARRELGWTPEVSFEKLVEEMVDHDYELALQERTLKQAGHLVAPRGGAHA